MEYNLNLIPQRKYCVIKSFTDFDQKIHPVGEAWLFIESNFLPFDSGLTLHVIKDHIPIVYRLQWRSEQQAEVLDHFNDYVELC